MWKKFFWNFFLNLHETPLPAAKKVLLDTPFFKTLILWELADVRRRGGLAEVL